jgi:dienelactone hydrolase
MRSMSRRAFLQSSLAACCAPLIADDGRANQLPWLNDVQQPPDSLPAGVPSLSPLLVDAAGMPISTVEFWERRRSEIREAWLRFLGPVAERASPLDGDTGRKRPPEWNVLEEDHVDGISRKRIVYETEAGQQVEAYLMTPRRREAQRPGVVAFHSTVNHSIRQPAGIEGAPEKAFGLKLAQKGYVTLSPRNYLWPTNDRIDAKGEARRFLERNPGSKGMARMLLDGWLAVNILASLAEVDPSRLGCVGHSLGAKEALYLAAFDDRIKVSVSSEGGIGTTYSNWHDPWYLGEAIGDGSFQREHHELLACAAPNPFLLIGGDSADGAASWPFIEAALPVYRLYGEPPRLGLLNHKEGHSVPPIAEQRIYEWFAAYLPSV